MAIDFRKEQAAALARPRLPYCILARFMFWSMDLFYGKATTVPKIRFLEILARIPYQAWEWKQYRRLVTGFNNATTRADAESLIRWSREAQDNEYWHLLVASEKIKQTRAEDRWFRRRLVPPPAAFGYTLFSRLLAAVSIRRAWRLNAMFEDHAEHTFMQFVEDNPQMENETPQGAAIQDGRGPDQGRYASWADVFRRIALDERDHMNESLRRCGMADRVVPYADEPA